MPYTPTLYLLVNGKADWLAYLYGTARLVAQAELSNGRTLGVVAVCEEGASADRLMFLVNYQADRLRSGLHFAEVHGSCSEAMERFERVVTADANKVEGIPA